MELMDKLRKEHRIPIKNHMQSLSQKEIEKIRFLLTGRRHKLPIKRPIKKAQAKATTTALVTGKTQGKTQGKLQGQKPIQKQGKLQSKSQVKKLADSSVASVPLTPNSVELEALPALRTGIIRRKKVSTKPLPAIEKSQQIGGQGVSANKPLSSQGGGGATPVPSKEGERHIRPGLVASTGADILKKINESLELVPDAKVENKKLKKIADKVQGVRQFRATDFRKREMIFQPKKKRTTITGGKSTVITQPKAHKRLLKMYGTISIDELSHLMGVKKHIVMNRIKKEGLLQDPTTMQALLYEDAVLIADLFNFEIKNLSQTKEDLLTTLAFGDLKAKSEVKAPVVTVMGHVDHGKTTLLDTIRKSRVVHKEAGGITQHIGAVSVPVKNSFVTFIDTPGHAAFTNMRARGVKLTDIVVVVVAADDGVQPQTIEAVRHAQNAKVPIIVAMNKVDLEGIDLDKVKKQFMELNLTPEEWGGDTIFCSVSAKTGKGVQGLLEHIHLLADVHELKANPKRSAIGIVIESCVRKGRGQVISVLVQDGTLKTGQTLLIGDQVERVKRMTDDQGQVISTAPPGKPVEISGFHHPAGIGDNFYVVKSEKDAKRWLQQKKLLSKEEAPLPSSEELLFQTHVDKTKTLPIILKTDVAGSTEAITYSLNQINTEEVKSKIIHAHLGAVNENDVLLAEAGKAVILCFNVGVDSKARQLITQKGIVLKSYDVIYKLLSEVEALMAALLDPEVKEVFGGKAEVKQVFRLSQSQVVAGCRVMKGQIQKDHFIRVLRDNELLCETKINSLKHFKQAVKSVAEGGECGIGVMQFNQFQPGDVLEGFEKTYIKRTKLNSIKQPSN